MGRPRCDPFDANAVALAIEAGETTPLRAYEAYASVAARPYARSSWEVLLNNYKDIETDGKPPLTITHTNGQASYWFDPVKPSNILTTTFDNASLKVKGGALFVVDGDRKIIYEQRGLKPQAIVMTGWGGYITIEAIRFCTDYNIVVIILDWSRDLMSVVSPSAKQSGPLICAQATCDKLPIAKALIQAKIEAHAKLGAISHTAAANAIASLNHAGSIAAILIIEAQAARLAWVEHTIAMQWREAGSVPKGWKLPYGLRRRMTATPGTKSPGAKAATDPINSMLNLALAVTIGRITAALTARGLSPAIGIIHKSPRWPLSYDAIEPLRPHIEAATFGFIELNKFSPDDFHIEKVTGRIKATVELSRAIIDAAAISQTSIDKEMDRLISLLNCSALSH
jgi:CRISPR/Cas system-associated endonuclease Cas1